MEQPIMELAGIRLRPFRSGDAADWHTYLSDPQVTDLTSYPTMSLADVESMLQRHSEAHSAGRPCTWAVAMQGDNRLIGTCGFNEWSGAHAWAELAYALARPYWGRGIISHAVAACLDFGFATWSLNRIHAFVMVGNVRSEHVLKRAGFMREGCLRSYRMSRGEARDFSVFSLLRDEWDTRQQKRG